MNLRPKEGDIVIVEFLIEGKFEPFIYLAVSCKYAYNSVIVIESLSSSGIFSDLHLAVNEFTIWKIL